MSLSMEEVLQERGETPLARVSPALKNWPSASQLRLAHASSHADRLIGEQITVPIPTWLEKFELRQVDSATDFSFRRRSREFAASRVRCPRCSSVEVVAESLSSHRCQRCHASFELIGRHARGISDGPLTARPIAPGEVHSSSPASHPIRSPIRR